MDGSPTSKPPAEPGGTQRCAVCDALVSADAEWCGQCFAPLKEEVIVSTEARAAGLGIKITEVSEPGLGQDGDASASGAAAGESPGAKVRLTWPCPACENDNDIELSFCARCGTSFASLMKADEAPVRI